ncbi:MAG: 50S ribosomal protein L25 [Clostridiaceae bacterium]
MENINGTIRQDFKGKSARRIRRQGKVPGILYGMNRNNFLFEVSELELNREIHNNGEHAILNLIVEQEPHKVFIKEIQRDSVSHRIIHVDMEEITKDKTITAEIPINYVGEDKIANSGAIVQREKNSVKISCTPEKLPKFINVDLSKAQVGSVYRVADLEIGSEISIDDNIDSIIALIGIEKSLE